MLEKYLFRRQFILSSNSKFSFDGWANLKLSKGIYLSVHPDLYMTQSSFGDIQLTLLGFVVNPFEPMKSNLEILDDLVENATSFNDVLLKTDPLGGRWVIIYKDKQSFNIFHDPCGQRQVYYRQNNEHTILCGSDPAIMSHFVTLEKDISLEMNDFINSDVYEKKENAWIGSATIFKDVVHLMPNHYLNVNEKKSVRFWPNKPIMKLDLDKAVDLAAEILKGSLLAISNRYKLALAVTAGWDSRVLLAASKDIKDNVTYFVSGTKDEVNDKSFPDVVVPQRLFQQLGLPFYVQTCDVELDIEFKKILEANVAMARINIPKTKNIYKYHLDFDGMMSVNGNASEIARARNQPILPHNVTGANLSKLRLVGFGGISYVEHQLDKWIVEIGGLCKDNHLNIYDLLYWEQRMGNWGALYPAEQDISIDQLSPYNNRLLLSILLSVDVKYRIFPKYTLYYKMIDKLWKDTLQQPVGVLGFKKRIKTVIKYAIIRSFMPLS
jgi:hypothetical protein